MSVRIKLTANDIIGIISKCKDAGVLELKIGELNITFKGSEHECCNKPIVTKVPDIDMGTVEQVKKDALTYDEYNVRREQLEQMIIEDPVAYEQMIAESELTDEK